MLALDKLNNKLRASSHESGAEGDRLKTRVQKRFVAEVTMEVLTVSEEGCFIQKTDQSTGITVQYQLKDIRDVLDLPPTQVISAQVMSSPVTILAG